jgi:hypothetical protein
LIWRVFRKSSAPPIDAAWWQRADLAALAPTADAVEQLATDVASASASADDAERQDEMLSGLRDLVALVTAPELPTVPTQHRVIGPDRCHLIAPVSLGADVGSAGKLFLTATRLVFVSGRPMAWPWHRVRKVTRAGRDLVVNVAGEPEPLLLRCNSYGEAIAAIYMMKRLSGTGHHA